MELRQTQPVGGWKYGFGIGADGTGEAHLEVTVWRGQGQRLECKAIQGKLRQHQCLKKKLRFGEKAESGGRRAKRATSSLLLPAGSATPGCPPSPRSSSQAQAGLPRCILSCGVCPLFPLLTPAQPHRTVFTGCRPLRWPSLLASRMRVCFSPSFSHGSSGLCFGPLLRRAGYSECTLTLSEPSPAAYSLSQKSTQTARPPPFSK